MEARHKEIVAVLRTMLAVPDTGPHLSRYWQYCPDQSRDSTDTIGRSVPGLHIDLPPAFTFLEWLYLIDSMAGSGGISGVGRSAFYALLAPLGKLAGMVKGVEQAGHWQGRIQVGRAREFLEHLHQQYKIGAHYTAALGTDLGERYHRAHIPVEVLAALPWNEVTINWIVEADVSEPWYRRKDQATTQALEDLITASFGFDDRLKTLFWETLNPADLVRILPTNRYAALIARLRKERLSDAVLADTFKIAEVVIAAPRWRIERYFAFLFGWLGGVEFPVEASAVRSAVRPPPLPADVVEPRRATPPAPPLEDDGELDAEVELVGADFIEGTEAPE